MLEDVSDVRQQEIQSLLDRQVLLLLDLLDSNDGISWDNTLVSRVCATVSGLMEYLSLENTPSNLPLRSVSIHNYSLYVDGTSIVIPPDEVGAFMAPTVGLSVEKATQAWWSVAPLFQRHPGVLPNVDPVGYRPSWNYSR